MNSISHSKLLTLPLMGLLMLVGCVASQRSEEEPAVESWGTELDVKIGSLDDPDYALTWFRRMEVSPTGRMYTVHSMEQVVRVFERDGTFAGLIGGRGEGPGEFQNVLGIGWAADTLWVLDGSGYRFNQFTEAGEFITSFMVPFDIGDRDAAQPPRANGLLFDGTVHGAPPAFSNQVADGTLTHHVPMLLTRSGEAFDTLPAVAFGRNSWAISDPEDPRRGGMYGQQPFADGPLWGYVPGELAMIHLDREAPETAEAAVVRLTKLSFGGDTVFWRSLSFDPVPVQDEVADSLIDAMASMMAERGILGASKGQALEWAGSSFYRPAFMPGFTKMVLARDGAIWLKESTSSTVEASWLVLNAEGEPRGRVTLPLGLTVMIVDGEEVWGSESDDMDVPYLLRYKVVKP